MKWYEFIPCDTLFFKGASAMVMGENHSAISHFPPLPDTFAGAIRTKILTDRKVSFDDYRHGKIDPDIAELVGRASDKAPFSVTGPLLKDGNTIFIPAPYHWFKSSKDNNGKIIKSFAVKSELVKTPTKQLMWARGTDIELESLGGMWINLDSIFNSKELILRKPDTFYTEEIRSGNALQTNRKVRQSHLYSFTHVRLKNNISIIFGLDRDDLLDSEGIISLGGEKRFGQYKMIPLTDFNESTSRYFLALSMIPAQIALVDDIVACGKILYRGGWDMARGFHKPMIGYYPAGTVFNKKINNNCIAIKE